MNLTTLGVTPQKEKQFKSKGINSAEDLIAFVPRRYLDYSKVTGVKEAGERSCLLVNVQKVETSNRTMPILRATCETIPEKQKIVITWYRQNFKAEQVRNTIGSTVLVAGKTVWDYQNKCYAISAPDLFVQNTGSAPCIMPIYSKISGMSTDYLTSYIKAALLAKLQMKEPFPKSIVDEYSDLSIYDTYKLLHFPQSMEDVEHASERLLCDDLLYFAGCNEYNARNTALGTAFSLKTLKLFNDVRDGLSFALTDDQSKAVNEMIAFAKTGKRINALVQGDVGCGKTIVAVLLMCAYVGSGYQVAMMAPTQVLAKQHYTDICSLLEPYGIKIAFLSAEMKAAEKKKVLASIETGEAQVIIGTHSVISKSVVYKNLALTVTDEEHKFGVSQRQALVSKGALGVNSITMSATPIPRSLAQAVYGNSVQLHTIESMPEGRKKVLTGIAKNKAQLIRFIAKEASQGRQTYVVCPLIEASEKIAGVRSVEEVGKEYTELLEPLGVKVATLTGKDSKEKTEETIAGFKSGDIMVLVATTVIEVGVNVPTASTIVIVNAERFGLASLHQLRGRVGRGSAQSFCVLETNENLENDNERIDAFLNNSSGFEIAKEDLRIRGVGDFIGTRQSGENRYLTMMLAYPDKYKKAQQLAVRLIDEFNWAPEGEFDEE